MSLATLFCCHVDNFIPGLFRFIELSGRIVSGCHFNDRLLVHFITWLCYVMQHNVMGSAERPRTIDVVYVLIKIIKIRMKQRGNRWVKNYLW